MGGVLGQWLGNENTVILIPSARARKQKFQFRAVIYNMSADGQLDAATREEVRVVVTRENTIPVWLREIITGQGAVDAYVGSMATIDITAFDAVIISSFRVERCEDGFVLREGIVWAPHRNSSKHL